MHRKRPGRHPRDPLGVTIRFECLRLDDFEEHLRGYLANPTSDPEHTTLEFSFPVTAAFMIPAREVRGTGDPNDKRTPVSYSLLKKTAVSVVDALHNIPDPKEVRDLIYWSSARLFMLRTSNATAAHDISK
jgi:hypothetical protein